MSVKRKPIRHTRDKEEYFRAEFRCPSCDQFLASYTFGRSWTDNALPQDRRRDCPSCGCEIDWSGVKQKEV